MQNITSETEFENHLRNEILMPLLVNNNEFQLYDFKKAVDILIARNGAKQELFFIEVKYHKISSGRLGFGGEGGSGFQPEVLIKQTDYFERNLIWILGHEHQEGYWIVNSETLRNYLNGGGVGEKYNGIKLRLFQEIEPHDETGLIRALRAWMSI